MIVVFFFKISNYKSIILFFSAMHNTKKKFLQKKRQFCLIFAFFGFCYFTFILHFYFFPNRHIFVFVIFCYVIFFFLFFVILIYSSKLLNSSSASIAGTKELLRSAVYESHDDDDDDDDGNDIGEDGYFSSDNGKHGDVSIMVEFRISLLIIS